MTYRSLATRCFPWMLILTACGQPDRVVETAAGPPVQAKVVPAAMHEIAGAFEAGGVVRARTTASITSRIVAEVREVRVRPGDRVRRGQPLVRLDDRDLTAAHSRASAAVRAAQQTEAAAAAERQAAETALQLARTTHERIATLHAKHSATPQEFDQSLSAVQAAEARLRAADARIAEAAAAREAAAAASQEAAVSASFAVLTAPFDGVITEKLIEPGNLAAPGVPLLTLEDTGAFRLEVRLDENRAALVKPGGVVGVDLDGEAESAGRVAEVARAFEVDSHTFLVKIDLPAGLPVRGGMFGRARFAEPVRKALAIPRGSVVRRGQLAVVFVVDHDGRAAMRPIRVGEVAGEVVEVLAGLDQGERIVVDPPPSLTDGAIVRPLEGGPR